MSKKDFFINLFLIFAALAIHAGRLDFSKEKSEGMTNDLVTHVRSLKTDAPAMVTK